MFNFSMSGFDEAFANVAKVGHAINDHFMRDATMSALEPVAEAARSLAPVDSGDLRDSIVVTSEAFSDESAAAFDGRTVFVGPLAAGVAGRAGHRDAYYAGFIELGTVKMRAQPFLAPAWDAEIGNVEAALGVKVGEALFSAV
ncbi:HK97 gp10 family phage protein [Novosphingobium profundi]|uniref:HK97-gp10 family putative phage morphogenesis protein n=1 Tax=Novosphingobium profundi TaxID=1774954 RepID=UPI001BDAB1FB|nr:HK97-gp10 family putative phage morphogenesis protein [Novosphingobium profundi]MBT0667074.1 HK97 gp10 family phage protein [Novosphingobium profundi]